MKKYSSNHYQLDSKSLPDHFDIFYPHPLTIEIEKKCKQKPPKDTSVLATLRSLVYIVDRLTHRLAHRHRRHYRDY
jgi:hypothetical protein